MEAVIYFYAMSHTEMLHNKEWSLYKPLNYQVLNYIKYHYFSNQHCIDIHAGHCII